MKRISENQVFVYQQHVNYWGEIWGKSLVAVFRNELWAKVFIDNIHNTDKNIQYVMQDTQE